MPVSYYQLLEKYKPMFLLAYSQIRVWFATWFLPDVRCEPPLIGGASGQDLIEADAMPFESGQDAILHHQSFSSFVWVSPAPPAAA